MERRKFLKIGSMATAYFLLPACSRVYDKKSYNVSVLSDRKTGHIVREAIDFPIIETLHKEVLIVGGGVAGMAAAYHLKDRKKVMLCEMASDLGGSSSSGKHNGLHFTQGAHYDLAYPENYGEEGISLLKDLGVIALNEQRRKWEFVDQQFVIPESLESQCKRGDEFSEDVLPAGDEKALFLNMLHEYKGKLIMPTRLISNDLKLLEKVLFSSFIEELKLSKDFLEAIDYMLIDDYGAGANRVSALAGLHYFICRPYYDEFVQLFSPPEGNSYFINKMAEKLDANSLKTHCLVTSIRAKGNQLDVNIVDVERRGIISITADKVIYAGQKHALKFIEPLSYDLFKHTKYAPWVVVNVILNEKLDEEVYWQNEKVEGKGAFMGFVNSLSQAKTAGEGQVLTTYHCFKEEERAELVKIEDQPTDFVNQTVNEISEYFGVDISEKVEKVIVKVMGHAMPIPEVGFLNDDINAKRPLENLVYAGVDSGRLPLFFEAVDSGVQAAKLV